MPTLRGVILAAVAILAVSGCQPAYKLELDVSNASPADATLQIVAAVEADLPAAPFVHFIEVIRAGDERNFPLERPGPGGWTIFVNGEAVTDSDQWPSENPSIDLAIRVASDGSVAVFDT